VARLARGARRLVARPAVPRSHVAGGGDPGGRDADGDAGIGGADVQCSGFNIQTFADIGLGTLGGPNLTNFDYLPSGRIFAIGKTGFVAVGPPPPSTANQWSRVTVNGADQFIVNSDGDRGLTGLALAVDFASSGRLYLAYNYDGQGCPGAACGRIASFLANDAGNPTNINFEKVIMDGLPSFSATGAGGDNSHTVGTVIAAPDGTLFIGNGDASSYFILDQSSFKAQNLDSPHGKIFHVDANGNGLSFNPYYNGDPGAWRSKVYTYGHRNPFRFSLKPGDERHALHW
jgi:hypothetical protein